MQLDMSMFNPCVLRASMFDGYVGGRRGSYAEREVYDYELEYYTRSDGGIVIDGTYVPFAAGDVNVRRPGQLVQGVPPYRCFIICFDARGNGVREPGYAFGTRDAAQPRYQNPVLDALPDRVRCAPGGDMEKLFERAFRLEGDASPAARLYSRTALMDILAELTRLSSPGARRISPQVRRVARIIEERFAEELSVDALMDMSGMSRATFHRRFLREMGRTPLDMITALRMGRARELLRLTDYPIGDIAGLCGYADNSYFSRIFRRCCGATPAEFRRGR